MVELIRAQGTMYLLGEPDRMRVVRPLLSMIAAEMFAGRRGCRPDVQGHRPRRSTRVLDELRSGVRVATLPDIASEKRKFRIGYLYACTNGGDEAALYGDADAARLKAAAGISIYGGLDEQSVADITDRAGDTPGGHRLPRRHRREPAGVDPPARRAHHRRHAAARRRRVRHRRPPDLLPFLAFTPACTRSAA